MLHFILIAQLSTVPDLLSPQPASIHHEQGLNDPREQQKRKLQEQQLGLDLSQKRYELEKQELEVLPTSRIDCFPLFPPISGFPPGTSAISCHQP
jgi:hypothetical protein